jgi:hypothetical protein
MEKVKYIGRTAIGSHNEKNKDGKEVKVIDYAGTALTLATPQSVTEAVQLLGEKRTLYLVRYALRIANQNAIRSEVLDCRKAGDDTGEAYVAAVNIAFKNYPKNLPDTGEREKGVRRSVKELARAKALGVLVDIGSSYESLPAKGKAAFDAKYPVEVQAAQGEPQSA